MPHAQHHVVSWPQHTITSKKYKNFNMAECLRSVRCMFPRRGVAFTGKPEANSCDLSVRAWPRTWRHPGTSALSGNTQTMQALSWDIIVEDKIQLAYLGTKLRRRVTFSTSHMAPIKGRVTCLQLYSLWIVQHDHRERLGGSVQRPWECSG
jgi:hypothetical protein